MEGKDDSMTSKDNHDINVEKAAFSIMLAYIALVVAFYYLAGDQLHYRVSRGNLQPLPVESGTVELVDGTWVDQIFKVRIQRLESISVQWGNFYRRNAGTAVMELYNLDTDTLLLSQSFNVADIQDGGFTTLIASQPIETVYNVPLLLHIYADSQSGSACTPLMSFSAPEQEDFFLAYTGEITPGMLCFSVNGEDYIWTGLHYWEFAVGFGVFLVLAMAMIRQRYRHGKRSYIINAMIAMKKYSFLIRQLVSRDFKTKYKRSVLGVFWSFLNPLLTMIVQYTIFSTLFKSDIPQYGVYLITGVVLFNFFTEATGMALGSIIGNAGLIKKVYMPKYIYPLTRIMSSAINLLISLIPLMMVVLFSGLIPTKSYLLLPFVLVCLTLFSLGVGLLLAASMVLFRDTQFLWGVLSLIWMYATPIFYPASILPDNLVWVLKINPLYYFVTFARTCVMSGISPEPVVYARCFMMAMGALLVGALVFCKTQDRFVLYL